MIAGALCVASAASAVVRRDPLIAALWLAVTMLAIAMLYLSLDAPLLAGLQLVAWVGAAMAIAVVAVGPRPAEARRGQVGGAAMLLAAALLVALALAVGRGELPLRVAAIVGDGDALTNVVGRYAAAIGAATVLLALGVAGAVAGRDAR